MPKASQRKAFPRILASCSCCCGKKRKKSDKAATNITDPLTIVFATATPHSGVFTDFQRQALEKHNEVRAMHGAPALELDANLCVLAQDWANEMAENREMKRRPGRRFGENLDFSFSAEAADADPLGAVDRWYSEMTDFDFANPDGSEFGMESSLISDHFTQVVWASSRRLGVGAAFPESGSVFVCALYDPPGNVYGHYAQNVRPISF